MRRGKFSVLIYLFIISIFLSVFLFSVEPVAAEETKFTPQISIGDFTKGDSQLVQSDTIGRYIHEIYKYAIGVVGIVSAVVIMFGGLMWIMAGGNASKIDDAKSWIGAALIGLVLALFSFAILKTVNPELVKVQPIDMSQMGNPITCCHPEKGETYFIAERDGDYILTCTPQTKEDKEIYGSSGIPNCDDNQVCRKTFSGYKCIIKDDGGCCGTKTNFAYTDYYSCKMVDSEDDCGNSNYYHMNQTCEEIDVNCQSIK